MMLFSQPEFSRQEHRSPLYNREMAMHNYEVIKSYRCIKQVYLKHQFPTEIDETQNACHAMSSACFPTKN